MKIKSRTCPVFFHTVQVILALTALQMPVIGHCDSGTGWFKNLFESKGKNMKEVAVKVAELPEQYINTRRGLSFSRDDKQLAVVSDNEKINIWDWQSARIVHTVEKAQGANDASTTEPIRYSPDGRLFVSCSDIITRIWNTETWAVVHDITDLDYRSCNAIGFTSDGKSLVQVAGLMGSRNNLTIYDTSSWQPVWSLHTVPFYPSALAISPDGKFAAIGGGVYDSKGSLTQQIVVADLARRVIVRTIRNTLEFDNGQIAWSPDGAFITAIGRRGWDGGANNGQGAYTSGLDTVMIFDAHIGKQVAGEQLEDIEATSLRYTPEGKYLIEGVMNGRGSGLGIRIWDGKHHELLQEIPGEVTGLAVSGDGHYFAASNYKQISVWQLK